MRILLVVHHFFPDLHAYAGTERYTLLLAKQMQKMGHNVRVLTYSISDSTEVSWKNNGRCMYKEYEYQGVPVTSVRHRDIPFEAAFRINDNDISEIVEKTVFAESFDIVHMAHPLRLASAVKIAKSRGIPVVLMLCDFWLMCPMGILLKPDNVLCAGAGENMNKCREACFPSVSIDTLENRKKEAMELFFTADTVTARSRFLKEIFFENGWRREISVDTHGVDYSILKGDIEKRYDNDSPITFGFIGTVQRHKGPHVMVEAFRKVALSNIRLEIWGGHHIDAYYDNLKKLAAMDGRISFHGKYDYKDIYGVLERIDVGVVPSIWWENAPQVMLALLANRIPAVVSALGGMTELVRDGIDGFYFKAGDVVELSGIIEKIGKDPSILNSLRQSVRMPAKFEEEAFEYEKIYKNTLLRKNKSFLRN